MNRLRWTLAILFIAVGLAACGATIAEHAATAAAEAAEVKVKAGAPTAPLITPLPAPKDVTEADDQVKHWHDVADQARQDAAADRSRADASDQRAAAADAQAAIATKRAEALRIALWRSRLLWGAGVALLGILAGVALEFILPTPLRGWATRGILAFAAIAVAALVLRAVLPWLIVAVQVAAYALAAGVVGLLLWLLGKAIVAIRRAADHGEAMEGVARSLKDFVDGDVLEHLISTAKAETAAAQHASGVRDMIDAVRGRPIKRPLPVAKPMPDALTPPTAVVANAPTESLPAVQPAPPAAKPPAGG